MNDEGKKSTLFLKLKKVVRYVSLYGLSRTLVKIKGSIHMKASEDFGGGKWVNKDCKDHDFLGRSVAIIGCGNFAFSNIAFFCYKKNKKFLRATYDPQKNRSRSLCKAFNGAFAVENWHEILADPNVRLVFIASNHASHAEYAIECIKAGKHVHIEKPHAVTLEQLDRLIDAMSSYPGTKIFLGFNRPRSPLFKKLKAFIDLERGPLMINWFVAGHAIPDEHWYYDNQEGGRVLGNLFHWTDLTLHLVSLDRAFPCNIIPTSMSEAKSEFVLTIVFADQSCAAITFSAKGETFEGVREILNLQKGDLVATLKDFQSLHLDIADKKHVFRARHRDHGHQANIVHSLDGATEPSVAGEDILYVSATARLVMAAKEAVESGAIVKLSIDDIKNHII